MSNRIIQKNNHSTSAITPQREQFLRKKIAHLKKTINGNGDLNTKPDQSYLHHNSLGLYGQKGSDDFTIRLKPTEAGFSPAQLKNIAQTASNYGQDALYLTSRQEVEIPLLPVEHTPDALEYLLSQRIDISGSTHNVFNIVNPEDAGTSLQEKFDTTPHVLALNRILNHSSNSSLRHIGLRIGFAGDYRDNTLARYNDIGFIATTREGERGFRVFIGGVPGPKPTPGHLLSGFLEETEILYVIETIKRILTENEEIIPEKAPNLRYIIDHLGREKAFKLFSSYYPDIKQEKKHYLSPKELRLSFSTPRKPGNINFPLLSRQWVYRYVRDQKQSGLFSVELPLSDGNISASGLIRLAEFLTPLGDDNIRISVHRNFFLRNIPGAQLLPLQGLLKDISNQNDEKEDISPITLNGHNILERLRKTGCARI
ncbi:ferredoxin--nitrite reductase [Marinilabilia salmonicolor]|uniref:ferredoxin--nitrite reductase n=1 Tax=Marinilabilia salmonicolor TaxID=989 RepID=UPI00029A8FFA|nr:ferredoxin--nitrite reductase [Marinilabilia salmonicolor]